MFLRKREGSVLCPSCGQLVGVNDDRCLNCGRLRPGLWGLTSLLKARGDDMGFTTLVVGACGLLYIACLAVQPDQIGSEGLLGFLSPGGRAVFRFGASGALPVFGYGRWWTPLSAGWLHGSLLHIAFNMMAVRDLLPITAHLYGAARNVIIYVVAGVTGFLASSLAGAFFVFMPRALRGGAGLTLGAIFGLIGAIFYYGRRSGSRLATEHATRWAIGGLLFGFAVPGIDNWAHIGGFVGGYFAARWLDPLREERGDHVLGAALCLLASLAAIVASVVTDVLR
jgi:rhomboid protease GluP